MELEFWGVRGTTPVSGKDKNKYGGHTPSASLLTSEGELIVVDAGTGIRKLGDKLIDSRGEEPMNLSLLFTHFHLDHIMGLPFFAPFYSSKTTLTFYAACNPEETEKYLRGLMTGRYFPLEFNDAPSRKMFKKIPDENFRIGGAQISFCPLHHPQDSVAFKIRENEKQVIFATDTEHPEEGIDERLASFAREADILIYDATFTPEEYESGRHGWGHSTWLDGTKLARAAGAGNLYLSHFNPNHSDEQIYNIISLAQEEFPETCGAREGLKVGL